MVALVIAGVMAVAILDHFGFLDTSSLVMSGLKRIKVFAPYVRTYELGLSRSQALARERTKLEDARQALELRAKEIAKEAADLEERRRRSQEELAQLEARRDELLKAVKGAEQLDRVARLCGAMPTAGAVRLLGELEDAAIAQVLARLPDKQAGAILNGFEAKRAARVLALMVRP